MVSKLTVRLHDLPEFFGSANFKVKAASDDEYRRLISEFVSFYQEHLFNEHWGEQAEFRPDNVLEIKMISQGLDAEQPKKVWQPFLDWVADSSNGCSIEGRTVIGSIPARHFWDMQWWKEHWPEILLPRNGSFLHAVVDDVLVHVIANPVVVADPRPGAGPNQAWWKGNTGEVDWFIWGYESLWLPESLLGRDAQQRLSDALFAASRHSGFSLRRKTRRRIRRC